MYGICRIVPPPSWKPPCPLKEKIIWERSKFATRIQRLDKLQNRESMRKTFQVNHDKRKKRKCLRRGADHGNCIQDTKIPDKAEQFGFEPGPDFTLDEFQKYDDDFKAQYFWKNNNSSSLGGSRITHDEEWHPTIQDIEGEYWRMVEKPTEEIEVFSDAGLIRSFFSFSLFLQTTMTLAYLSALSNNKFHSFKGALWGRSGNWSIWQWVS